MPMVMNPIPAIYCKVFALTYCAIVDPAATPMADVTINANAAPMKTVSLLTSLSEANSIVANCVLSPSSAMKTEVKTVANIFQSIKNLLGL